jgi:hypothetical protein
MIDTIKCCDKTRVVYHGVTSSFFGIGVLPVSDLLGGWYFWLVLLGVQTKFLPIWFD